MVSKLAQLRALKEPKITINDAIAICEELGSKHPGLKEVAVRIKQLREERDLTRGVAESAMSDAAWERSDMKRWADRQSRDPDND